MNICIIGNGLASVSLANNLINKKINVHIYQQNKILNMKSNRTIGVSKKNLEFFEREIYKFPKKEVWKINKIEIFSETQSNNKILNFEKENETLFYMLKNDKLLESLNKQLLKSKFFKRIIFKKENFYQKLMKEKKYDLIINCDANNFFSKKYFTKKIFKDYNNLAYTTIIEHEKLKNNTAFQIFSIYGPIAFLPISDFETSVVCSMDVKTKKFTEKEILDLIKKNNPRFKIKKILKLSFFKLTLSSLRNYYYKNILAFGDLLHRIHPLAGQGFNMTIRDIKILSKIIQNKIDLGMQLDFSILKEFENETKHLNFSFLGGIDFIYEFFNLTKKTKNKNLNKILKYLGRNKILNKTIIKLADNGLDF